MALGIGLGALVAVLLLLGPQLLVLSVLRALGWPRHSCGSSVLWVRDRGCLRVVWWSFLDYGRSVHWVGFSGDSGVHGWWGSLVSCHAEWAGSVGAGRGLLRVGTAHNRRLMRSCVLSLLRRRSRQSHLRLGCVDAFWGAGERRAGNLGLGLGSAVWQGRLSCLRQWPCK